MESQTPSPAGLLLVGHGTRESAGVAEFDRLARIVAERVTPIPVAPCFLELAQPTIASGVDHLAAAGVRHVVVAPLLLFASGHAKRDIPAAVAAAVARHPGITFRQAPHLGLHPRVLELAKRRFIEAARATETPPSPALEDTLLLVVGRGSSDADALAEFDQFARRHHAALGCGELRTAFMALAEPDVADALDAASRDGRRRIVVQPHLLFGGVLVDRLANQVALIREKQPDRQWVVTSYLGPDENLAEAVVDLTGLTGGSTPMPPG